MGRHSAPVVRHIRPQLTRSPSLILLIAAMALAGLSATVAIAKAVAPEVHPRGAFSSATPAPADPLPDEVMIEHLTGTVLSRSARQVEQAAAQEAQAVAETRAAEEAAVAAEQAAAEQAAAEAAAVVEAEQAEATPEPAEGVAVEPPAPPVAGGVAVISNSAGPVSARAQAAADAVVSNVPGAMGITIGGTRASAADPGGHPAGNALDYMVGGDSALGDAIVAYHIANWSALGVDYIIWQQQYLSSPDGAWEWMEDRGSPTANHYDHPHVNYVP
jgi:hypothetical protein